MGWVKPQVFFHLLTDQPLRVEEVIETTSDGYAWNLVGSSGPCLADSNLSTCYLIDFHLIPVLSYLLPLPRSSNLLQRGQGCVLWPPMWLKHPSPSLVSSMWWTVGKSRNAIMTVSQACPPSVSPGSPKHPLTSGLVVQAGQSQATAIGRSLVPASWALRNNCSCPSAVSGPCVLKSTTALPTLLATLPHLCPIVSS